MNNGNLVPVSERTPSELRKMTQKGGKASGVARRKKRDMRRCMEMLLSMPARTSADYQMLYELGLPISEFTPDEINNMLVVNAALLMQAKLGDVAAIKELRSIIRDDAFLKQKVEYENAKIRLEEERLNKDRDNTDVLDKLDAILDSIDGGGSDDVQQ